MTTELTISRELRSNGRAVARVNGVKVTVSLVRTLSELLVDIHGQAEHLSLLNTKQHIILLDRYANVEHALVDYQKDYRHCLRCEKNSNRLSKHRWMPNGGWTC